MAPLRLMRRLALAPLLFFVSACAAPRGAEPAPSPGPDADAGYVVLVSLDGFRHDYLARYRPPHLSALAARGAVAEALVPVFPTKTFPNHYGVVTGMRPGRHGLVGNHVFEPSTGARYRISDTAAVRDARWYGGEPVWVAAERQGVRAASFFWPGSEAAIGGVRPSRWKRYDGSVPNEARVDTVLSWLALPPAERPRMLTLYFSAVDDAAHRFGPDGAPVADSVAAVDAALGRLLRGIESLPHGERVNVVVVSDHGLTAVEPGQRVALEDHVALDGIDVVVGGPYAQLFFRGDTARREAAYRALQALPHARVYRAGELPERLDLGTGPRAGDLVVVMEAPWQVEARRSEPRSWPAGTVRGAHGFDPAHPDMHGLLVAAGPGIRPGARLGRVENFHVYALLMHLLRLEPNPDADASVDEVRAALK